MQLSEFPGITRGELTTLQVNLGYKCNQRCSHCHVDAGPNRTEMMDSRNVSLIPKVLEYYNLNCLDLTGGAPELHPDFKELVTNTRKLGIEVIDRCNLTILVEPGQEDLGQFLADNQVTITASLPCYEENNVDNQRGYGVFKKSLAGLRILNKLGYGKEETDLVLNLVYNPIGAKLPPPQKELESDYRHELLTRYGVNFNNLFTITNMPIKRFKTFLEKSGAYIKYQELLRNSYNSRNLDEVMCRTLISIDWKGFIYDCDFNQQLELNIDGKIREMKDLLNSNYSFNNNRIRVGNHCFGCTAGNGSSCGGSLNE